MQPNRFKHVFGYTYCHMFTQPDFLLKIINTINEGVVVYRLDGTIVSFNKQAPLILELTPDQLYQRVPMDSEWCPLDQNSEPLPYEQLPTTITRNTGKPVKNSIVGLLTGK